jgi:glycosyltransferase involved in cell wall biosynthesis
MRIWIINHYALPPTSAGGTRHYNFARQLQKRGHEVLIIAANYNHFSHTFMSTSGKFGELDTTYDVPFVWLPVPAYKGNTVSRFWNMLSFAGKVFRNKFLLTSPPPDVIIGSSPHLFAALGAELLAKKLKKPFILEIRDLWPETLIDLGKFSHKHPLIKMMKWIEAYLYKRANHIISLLPASDKYLTQCGVLQKNITWLPNSVDVVAIPFDTLSKTPNNKFTVMYAGAHGLANDLDTVIYAAKILQNNGYTDHIRICLIGDGPSKMQLKQLALRENVQMVEFFDSVSKKEIYSTLNQADVFLMLLKKSPVFRWGISPNKLFDYLVMERPVIFGVETPFNPIEKYNAGISIQPSDPESLASAIQKLYLLPKEELMEMGQRGKSFVLQHHDIVGLTDSLEKAMDEAYASSI